MLLFLFPPTLHKLAIRFKDELLQNGQIVQTKIQILMFRELPGKETVSVSQWEFGISSKCLVLVVNNTLGH